MFSRKLWLCTECEVTRETLPGRCPTSQFGNLKKVIKLTGRLGFKTNNIFINNKVMFIIYPLGMRIYTKGFVEISGFKNFGIYYRSCYIL